MPNSAPENSPELYFRLLGPPRVFQAGEELTDFRTAKNEALLYYLAVAGGNQRRATLADLLWQDATEQQARASLRSALYSLRQLLDDHLLITRQTVALDQLRVGCDVLHFERLLRRTGDPEATIVQFEAAVSLYTGDFLSGFHVSNAAQFELWAAQERTRLHDAMLNALLKLADWHSAHKDLAGALDHTNRLLSLDPVSELGHRQKMELLARTGRRSAALSQYEACKSILSEEMDVMPAPETTALYELILAGKYGADDDEAGPIGGELAVAATAQSPAQPAPLPTDSAPLPIEVDFGEMPRQMAFFGRQRDLAHLVHWLTLERCSLVVVEGMGGLGKTTLATEAFSAIVRTLSPNAVDAHSAAPVASKEQREAVQSAPFDRMVWRSLVNAPTLSELLGDILGTILNRPPEPLPGNLNDRLSLLFKALGQQRCLLVLDNVESILTARVRTGEFRAGYEDYGQLIDRVARGRHKSCLLMTTRELPKGVRRLEEDVPAVRTLSLAGLPTESARELFEARGVLASGDAVDALVQRYSGNPLALKLVADTVRDLFNGDIESFLDDDALVFDDIRDVLDQQFGRLSDLEKEIVVWLAIEREAATAPALWNNLVRPFSRSDLVAVMRSLLRGSLLQEESSAGDDQPLRLGLPNVVMEYVTDRLIEAIDREIAGGQLDWLHRFTLLDAQKKEYVQQSQRRILLEPVARRLVERWGQPGAVQQLERCVNRVRDGGFGARGYAGANILQLLLQLRGELNNYDFSGLAIWRADLRWANLAATDFSGVDFSGSVFSDTFGAISSVAASPDGAVLTAGGTDGAIHVWQTADYRPARIFESHNGLVAGLAFTEDSQFLAGGAVAEDACLWNLQTGARTNVLQQDHEPVYAWFIDIRGDLLAIASMNNTAHVWNWKRSERLIDLTMAGLLHAVALSPDARLLAAVGDGLELGVWEVSSGELLYLHPTIKGRNLAVAFSPDGRTLATGGEDNCITLWHVADMHPYLVLEGHNNWVLTLDFLADGKQLASGSADHTVHVWDIETGKTMHLLSGHRGWVRTLACSPDGQTIYSSGDDQTVRVWNAATGELRHYFQGYMRWVDFVQFSPDGQRLASRGVGGVIRLWDVATGRLLHQFTGDHVSARALAFSSDGGLLAAGNDDSTANLWNTQTGALLHTFRGHRASIRDITFSPDNRFLVTGSHDDTVRVWDITTGDQRLVVEGANALIQFAMAFDPQQRVLAFGALDNTFKVLDLASMQIARSIPVAGGAPSVIAFSPRGDIMACGTRDGIVWLWKIDENFPDRIDVGHPLQQLHLTPDPIWRLLFSQDGRSLVVSSGSSDTLVLDVESGEERYAVPCNYGAFCSSFSSDGRWLATATDDHTIVIRDAVSGKQRQVLRGHTSTLTSLNFNAQGDRIASSSADGSVRLWDWERGGCVAVLEPPGPYAGMNIAGATGITRAQRAALMALGAVEV